jgi:hypothetical protein
MEERNFILTDVMKTGSHQRLESFINFSTLPGQQFDMTEEWYSVPEYDLKKYTRRIALVDFKHRFWGQETYQQDLNARIEYLNQQGFTIIIAQPWESQSNVDSSDNLNKITIRKKCYWCGEASWFWWRMFDLYKDKKFDVDHSNKKYDFFYLNKYPRKHRIQLFKKIKSAQLLDNSLYSFLSEGTKLNPEYELPWVDANNYPTYGFDRHIYEPPYNYSAYNIVSETHDSGDTFITEKIWKPIIMQQIFVVHSKPHYLKTLRELGFQTFGSVFDESYDEETDSDKRIDKIVELCKFLKSKDPIEMYKATKSIRQHNTEHFFKESAVKSVVNETVLGLLKSFDRSQISS